MTTKTFPTALPAAASLPEFCASINPSTGKPVLIRKGQRGFWDWPAHAPAPEDFNKALGVTAAEVKAMEAGSMFGFHVPAADPAFWEA